MRKRFFLLLLLASITTNVNSQNFSSLSGTVRIGMPPWPWGLCSMGLTGAAQLTRNKIVHDGPTSTIPNWLYQNHNSFRFFNMGYDFIIPYWSMTSADNGCEIQPPFTGTIRNDQYINYIGYFINWKSLFSRFGFYCGIDYEWRRFRLLWQDDRGYHPMSNHVIQSLVPSVGLRYRIIDPTKEIEGFPINIVLEAGVSYAIAVNYKIDYRYTSDSKTNCSTEALNNGLRSMVGISVTTNKFGSIHLRWSKDLYNFYNNDYVATDEFWFLFTDDIGFKNNFSCISFGWATFL